MPDPANHTVRPTDRDDQYVIAVDLGTGGPKIGFVSVTGRVAHCEHHRLDPTFLPDGGVTVDAEQWWTTILDSVRRILADGVIDPAKLVAVSMTGQWASTIPVDEAGVPVAPGLSWMDSRGGELVRARIGGPIGGYTPRAVAEFIRRSGGLPSLDGADPVGHRLFWRTTQPDTWSAARWLLEPVDYLSMRFTGIAAASAVSMTGSWLIDTRDPENLTYDPTLVRLAGGGADKLPPLHPFGSVVGTVQPSIAAALGIGDSVAVVTGSPDLHSAAIGTGAVRVGEAHMALSTTGWISAPVERKKTDLIRQVATVAGIDERSYLVANNHETAGMCLQWFRDVLAGPDSDVDYDALTSLATSSPPGAGGVIFTPWLKGERSPVADRAARAGFHDMGLATTRADLVRAVMEGVAYNNVWLLAAVEKFVGARLDNIRMMGGGAQSDLWCQIHADTMDRTIEQVAEPLYCGLRGAALSAGMALGMVETDELRDLVEVRRTFRPDPANRATYDRLYREFPGLYSMQRKFFRRLNR
jgi:xylulokinase